MVLGFVNIIDIPIRNKIIIMTISSNTATYTVNAFQQTKCTKKQKKTDDARMPLSCYRPDTKSGWYV